MDFEVKTPIPAFPHPKSRMEEGDFLPFFPGKHRINRGIFEYFFTHFVSPPFSF
jgi:hypothetical protein